jgi:hypothetical protein
MNNIDKGRFIMLFFVELMEVAVLFLSVCIVCLVLTLEYGEWNKLLSALLSISLLIVSLVISIWCIFGASDILFSASVCLGVSGGFVFLGRQGHLKNKQHETL